MALPTAPFGIGTEKDAREEYFQALQKTLTALEDRNKGMNWFGVAGQLLSPGRTGNWAEGVGNAATEVGRQVERQKEAEIPMAQLRAQLMGQKYEIQSQAEAMGMLAKALGTTPDATATMLQDGTLPPGAISKITPQLYAAIATKSPKVGEMVKGIWSMDIDRAKLATDLYGKGVDRAKLEAEFGPGVLKLLPPQPFSAQAPAAAGSTTPAPAGATTPAPTAPAGPTPVVPGIPAATGQITSDQGMPLKAQASTIESRAKEMDKQWETARNSVYAYTPQMTSNAIRELKELIDIADKKPHILGMLQKEGVLAGMAAAAQEGISAGRLGQVSLPVQTFVEKYKLSRDDQRDLTIANRILANQFFENAKANKAVLGPQISNSDVMLLKAPVATAADSAEAIKYWAKQNILGNYQRADLYNALSTYDSTYGARQPVGSFFTQQQSPYFGVVKKYDSLFEQLTKDHSPTFNRK